MSHVAAAVPPRVTAWLIARSALRLPFRRLPLFMLTLTGAALWIVFELFVLRLLAPALGTGGTACPACLAVAALAALCLALLTTMLLCLCGNAYLNGRGLDVRARLATATRSLPPAAALCLVTTAAVSAGLVALVVPGLVLLSMWMLALPVMVCERRGIVASLRRSRALSRGNRLRLTQAFLAGLVLFTALGRATAILLAPVAGEGLGLLAMLAGDLLASGYAMTFPVVAHARLTAEAAPPPEPTWRPAPAPTAND